MPDNILKGTIQITAPGVQQTFAAVNTGVVNMERSLQRSDQAIAKSKTNFTGLSRVVQDLPFGFIAISNNLEQLLPAAGGAGLAFSTLISVLSFAQVGFANWTRGLGSSKESLKDQVKALHEAREELSDYVETLNDVNRARIVGSQNAQEELVKLQTLRTAIENANIPLARRKQYIDELRDQYPKYFANIQQETLLNGGATAAYNKLTTSILAASRARAGQDILVDISKQQIALEQEQLDNNQKLFDASEKINALRATGVKLTITSATGEERLTDAGAKMNRLQEEYNDILSEGTKLQKTNIDLFDRAKRITADINNTTQNNPDPNPKEKLVKVSDKKVKDTTNELARIIQKIKLDAVKIASLSNIEIPDTSIDPAVVGSFITNINSQLNREDQPPIIITPKIQLEIEKSDELAAKMKKLIASLNSVVTDAMKELATGLAESFGAAIGTAVAGGDIGNAFKALGAFIGTALQGLGQQMVALSPVIAALKAGIKTLNPAILLPAGIGLIAIGAILKNSLSNIPGFAKGGVVPPGYPNDTFLARLSSGERIVPAGQNYAFQPAAAQYSERLVSELSGDTLRLWLQRSNKTGGRY